MQMARSSLIDYCAARLQPPLRFGEYAESGRVSDNLGYFYSIMISPNLTFFISGYDCEQQLSHL